MNNVKNSGLKIMMVDDNKSIREMAEFMLMDLHDRNEVEKYEICHSAEKAWARLMMQEGKFDILLTDVNMSGISGIELAKKVRKEFPHIKCIISSALDYNAEAQEIGVTFFLKPYNLYELLKR